MDLPPPEALSPATALEAISRGLSTAGRAIVVVSVEELERIVEAAVRRAVEVRDAIDAGDWPTAAAAKFQEVHRRTIGEVVKRGELRPSKPAPELTEFDRHHAIKLARDLGFVMRAAKRRAR